MSPRTLIAIGRTIGTALLARRTSSRRNVVDTASGEATLRRRCALAGRRRLLGAAAVMMALVAAASSAQAQFVDLSITKTDFKTTHVPGTQNTYMITVSNSGPSDAVNAVVMDVLPPSVYSNCVWSCVATPGSTCTPAGAGDINEMVTIAPGGMLFFTVICDSNPAATGIVTNIATVAAGGGQIDTNANNNAAADTDMLTPQWDIGLHKDESADPITAGKLPVGTSNTLTHTIYATNNGPSVATNVMIFDDLTFPAGVSVTIVTPSTGAITQSPPAPPDFLWTIPTLAVNATATADVVMAVAPSAPDNGHIDNTAILNAVDLVPFNNTTSEQTTIQRIVDITVDKVDSTHPDPVIAGSNLAMYVGQPENLVYTLTVTNLGPSNASGVKITDIPMLPADVTLIPPVVVSQGMMQGTNVWDLGNLAPGGNATMARHLFVGPSAVAGTNVIENAATVTDLNEDDSNNGSNADTEYTSIDTNALVTVMKEQLDPAPPDPVIAGENLTYKIIVTNTGPSDAQNVVVTDSLPAQVVHLSNTCGATVMAQMLEWNIGTLAAMSSVECEVTVMVLSDTTDPIDNTAVVEWDDTVDPGNNNGMDPVQVPVDTMADLSITKTDDVDPILAGEILTYTVEVSNAGPSDAQDVNVMESLPAQVMFLSSTGCMNDPNGAPNCTVGTIAAGATHVITYMVKVDPLGAGTINNCATVTSSTTDPNPGQEQACETTQIISQDSIDTTGKGSLLVFSKVDLRWDDNGFLLQDTFISLTNDYPEDVNIQLYFVNGDPALPADPATGERAHPGWNWLDNLITLTGDQPTYWSCATGAPGTTGGLSPFPALDPGFPPGRPNPEGGRMLRGFILGWAADDDGYPVKWNHLKGEGTIVDYERGAAWEYNGYMFRVVTPDIDHGQRIALLGVDPGVLPFNGLVYNLGFNKLVFNFQAVGSSAFSGSRQVVSDTDLTLFPLPTDLRQETDGPVTTKANFEVWNENEIKFTGLHRCITCWDQTLMSDYGFPNHFLVQNLQTDHGTARVDGIASQVCNFDYDPGNNFDFPFPPGPGDPVDPRDVISQDAPLLGVIARILSFDGGADWGYAGVTMIGTGKDGTAAIRFDPMDAFEEADIPAGSGAGSDLDLDLPLKPTEEQLQRFIDRAIRQLGK